MSKISTFFKSNWLSPLKLKRRRVRSPSTQTQACGFF